VSAPRGLAGIAALGAALCVLGAAPAAQAQRLWDGDILVVQPEVGVSMANVYAFSNNNLIPGLTESRVSGPRFGGTVGVRLGPVMIGAHGDLSRFKPYDVGTLGARVEVRLAVIGIQPFVRAGLGYAWLGDINPSSPLWTCGPTAGASAQCPDIRGWHATAGGGIDYAVMRHFTIGAALDLSVLNLTRSASPTMVNLQQEGDSVGIQATLSVHAALRL
jgi:hypothetical protein